MNSSWKVTRVERTAQSVEAPEIVHPGHVRGDRGGKPMFAVAHRPRQVKALGIAFALLNVVLWYSVPAIRATIDSLWNRHHASDNPMILNGVQELFVYFDPWLARGVFPIVYTLGLGLIPFLSQPHGEIPAPNPGWEQTIAVPLLLLGLEAVWLFLIVVAVFLRGPNWNLYWPWEPWDEPRGVPLNLVNVSEYFWVHRMNRAVGGMPWLLREVPGLALLVAYFVGGFFIADPTMN